MFIFLFGFSVLLFIIFKIYKKNLKTTSFKIFKATKTIQKFSLYSTICNLVDRKLKNNISLSTFIDKKVFDNLKLNYAPVYVLDVKKVGLVHVRLFLSALKNFDKNFNLVLINADNLNVVSNAKFNILTLKCNQLTYENLCLLNNLNVNQVHNNEINMNFDFNISNFNIDFNTFNVSVNLEQKGMYKLTLPYNPFGYLTIKKQTLQVCDVFGDIITEIKPKVNTTIVNNNLYIKTTNPVELNFKLFYSEAIKNDLKLFTFDINFKEFSDKIQWLKSKAIEEIKDNPFIDTQIRYFKFNSLTNFFKLAILRKHYLNDYLILIKNIFGLYLNNNILNVNPCEFIIDDFSVKYVLNNEEFQVNYTFSYSNKIKLSYVGHKLGVKDKFVYGK